jgi:RNA polymerase sigma-70 factor (ECF subfamily)
VAFFADFAEVKRMYVRDIARGRGVAQAVLARIEAEARKAGLALLRLESVRSLTDFPELKSFGAGQSLYSWKLRFKRMLTTALPIANWPRTVDEFDALIEATQDELVHFAFYRLGNHEDAEDVVQDVYVQAFRERNERGHITGVRPYLFRMVNNRCIDLLRARSRQPGDSIIDEPLIGENAFSSVAAREQAETLSHLLESIPKKEAEVIRLRAFSELSFAEVAEAVGSSVPTVKSRFRYGLDKLRRLLCPEGGTRNELPRR